MSRPTDHQVEAGARALHAHLRVEVRANDWEWDEVSKAYQDILLGDARAVLETGFAAVDPTEAEAAIRVTGEGAMFGRMDSADFSADTLTFTMEPGYYAAAGRYLIVPVPAIDAAMKGSKP
jgi:hypothetical protein